MKNGLPLLSTSVVGSYARPAWVWTALEAAERGELGPADIKEVLDDAVDMALRDQEEAGVDVVSDGEMRRAGFFTAEFYAHLTGLRALEPERRKGPAGHDQQHRFEVLTDLSTTGTRCGGGISICPQPYQAPDQGYHSRPLYALRTSCHGQSLQTTIGRRLGLRSHSQC